MKKIYFVILLLVGMATTATMTSCSSDDDPISTAQVTDDPRILDPIFPDRVNGELPVVATVNRDQNFSMKLIQNDLDLIAQQAGILCVGHGYYVDRITKQ